MGRQSASSWIPETVLTICLRSECRNLSGSRRGWIAVRMRQTSWKNSRSCDHGSHDRIREDFFPAATWASSLVARKRAVSAVGHPDRRDSCEEADGTRDAAPVSTAAAAIDDTVRSLEAWTRRIVARSRASPLRSRAGAREGRSRGQAVARSRDRSPDRQRRARRAGRPSARRPSPGRSSGLLSALVPGTGRREPQASGQPARGRAMPGAGPTRGYLDRATRARGRSADRRPAARPLKRPDPPFRGSAGGRGRPRVQQAGRRPRALAHAPPGYPRGVTRRRRRRSCARSRSSARRRRSRAS